MESLGWVLACLSLVAAFGAAAVARKATVAARAAREAGEQTGAELERILEGFQLAEQAAATILSPDEFPRMIETIARQTVDLLDVEGACVLVRPPADRGEEAGVCFGRIPDGMEDVSRPVDPERAKGFGSVLAIPIRMNEERLGEFRIAEKPGRPLTLREVHSVRLLAQLVAIATQVRIQRRQLKQVEEDKRRFVLATTHDLRAPLTTIEQLTHVLLEGYAGELSPKQRELVEKIDGRSGHLLELLADLLSLAIEEQDLGILRPREPVSLREVFDRQAEAGRIACETKGVLWTARRPDEPLRRMASQGDMENILGNLISNAVKYTPPGGAVEVSLEDSPAGVLLRVRDTGIGIPEKDLPRLFTEHFRAPNARAMERHGTGLGLALVQRLVRKYGGRIRVDSVEGKGTLIEVFLPPE